MDSFDSVSVFSVDSLEEDVTTKHLVEKVKTLEVKDDLPECDRTVVPYYNVEAYVTNSKRSFTSLLDRNKPMLTPSSLPVSLKKREVRSEIPCNFMVNSPNIEINKSVQYLPSRNPNVRISRRHSNISMCQIRQPRHRSVSYLEQFRRQVPIVSKAKEKEESFTNADRKTSGFGILDDSLGETNTELKFYEELINPSNKNTFRTSTVNQLVPSSEITSISDKESSRNAKEAMIRQKRKIVVLPKIDLVIQVPSEKGAKSMSLHEKRQSYSDQVTLMNKIRFSKQKEKEKCLAFTKGGSRKEIPDCLSMCPKQEFAAYSVSKNDIPFLLNEENESSKLKTPLRRNRSSTAATNRRVSKAVPKEENVLETLRKRHDHEKQVVDRIRNVVVQK